MPLQKDLYFGCSFSPPRPFVREGPPIPSPRDSRHSREGALVVGSRAKPRELLMPSASRLGVFQLACKTSSCDLRQIESSPQVGGPKASNCFGALPRWPGFQSRSFRLSAHKVRERERQICIFELVLIWVCILMGPKDPWLNMSPSSNSGIHVHHSHEWICNPTIVCVWGFLLVSL